MQINCRYLFISNYYQKIKKINDYARNKYFSINQSWILTNTTSATGPVESAMPTPMLYDARQLGNRININKTIHSADKSCNRKRFVSIQLTVLLGFSN